MLKNKILLCVKQIKTNYKNNVTFNYFYFKPIKKLFYKLGAF